MHLVAPGAQVMLSLIFTAFEQDSRFHHPLSVDAPGAVGVTRLAWWLVEWVRQARRGPASQRPAPCRLSVSHLLTSSITFPT